MSAGVKVERLPDRVQFVGTITGSMPRQAGESIEDAMGRAAGMVLRYLERLRSLEATVALEHDPERQRVYDVRRAVLRLPGHSRRLLLDLAAAGWLQEPGGGVQSNGRRVAIAALIRRGFAIVEEKSYPSAVRGDYPVWGHRITESGLQAAAALELEQAGTP